MNDKLSREELVIKYSPEVKKLIKYLPWLQSKSGSNVSSNYTGNGVAEHSIAFPVYDSTLLNMVKEIRQSPLIDKNYAYIYSRCRISSPKDELYIISRAKLQDIHVLWGILSRYVLGGMTRSIIWTQGVQEGIFLAVVQKMKELIEFNEGPMT